MSTITLVVALLSACAPAPAGSSSPSGPGDEEPTLAPSAAAESSESPSDGGNATPAPPVPTGENEAMAIAAGGSHACAIVGGGHYVRCWGWNGSGQLGDGSHTARSLPEEILPLDQDNVAIAADGAHTCLLNGKGEIHCWGANSHGQMGNPDGVPEFIYTSRVDALAGRATAVVTAQDETCAVIEGGALHCWGANHYGQLGIGKADVASHPAPADVLGVSSVTSLAGGYFFICAVSGRDGPMCWGHNGTGQLGGGSADDGNHATPSRATELPADLRTIAAGVGFTCVLTAGGGVQCLGNNANGELGNGSATMSLTLVDVLGLESNVASIEAGYRHSCAVTDAGGVKCWGINDHGQLGDGSTTNRTMAVDVAGLQGGVAAVSAGENHTCALLTSGAIRCWGSNLYGQLGNGTTTDSTTPVDVALTPSWESADPRVVVQGLYDWYLSDPPRDELLRRREFSDDFRMFVTDFAGPYNPIVCGQDVPVSVQAPTVDYEGSGINEIAIVHTVYSWDGSTEIPGPDVRLPRRGRDQWEIGEIACGG